ncbi:MAG: zinc/manganese transport system substrate-binding protein [Chloroflexota bacterium]|jgi:ABC-type Zn uptake system ZnuABC Zn-binding protein ZnuA|nr:zinc/manganese transport system substrate-binding protein [Chloroflexota bacterium]
MTVGMLTLGLLTACSGTSSDSPRVPVVATTTQVGSIAAELGGDAIDLTVLLKPGIEAHDFEITPAGGAAIERAALILESGAGLETWLDDAIETIGGEDRVRDLSEGVDLRTAADGEIDPHYWMSAPNATAMVQNARDALVEVAPDAADGIAGRADILIGRLEDADREIRSLVDEIPADRRKVVTDHDALGYFLDEYGLEFLGSVFPTLDVSADPSARDIEDLVKAIRENEVHAIFAESAVNPQLAEAVAAETGATISHEPLYTDSLGPAGSGADTIDSMLLHNARVLHDGLLGS